MNMQNGECTKTKMICFSDQRPIIVLMLRTESVGGCHLQIECYLCLNMVVMGYNAMLTVRSDIYQRDMDFATILQQVYLLIESSFARTLL